MDGEKFDGLLRHAVGDGLRRGVLRAGLGALATSAFGGAGTEHDRGRGGKNRREAHRRKVRG